MKRLEFICALGGIATGFLSRRRTIIAAMTAMALLPIEISDASRLSHIVKSSSKHGKSSKHVTSPKPRTVKLAALGPVALNPSALKPAATMCDPSKFRIVLDVGHTAESEGAISARNVAEFVFNLRLAQRIEEKLKAEGFAETRLLLTEGKARPQPLQACRRRQQSARGSLPVDPP
jgi:N-acetylmuramoyl-L-alanine amidase